MANNINLASAQYSFVVYLNYWAIATRPTVHIKTDWVVIYSLRLTKLNESSR